MNAQTEQARFLRPAALRGVEALHAQFVHHRYAPHVHDCWVIACVDRGAARFELQGREHTAPAESAFVIPPGAVHTGESAAAGGYAYRVLYVDSDGGASDPGVLDGRPFAGAPVVENRRLLVKLRRTHDLLLLRGHALEQGEAVTAVCRLLSELTAPHARERRAAHPAVGRAKSFVEERWRENFTVTELADAAGLSPFHLIRLFRRDVGMPPSAYRRSLRVLAAQRMLRRGEAIRDVALACGFYDQAHLTRHFKATTGVTPARYAQAM